MPQLAELQERARRTAGNTPTEGEEFLVVDLRGQMTPAEMVEQKFLLLLETTTPPAERRRTRST